MNQTQHDTGKEVRSRVLIEVALDHAGDAALAVRHGADRIELVAELETEGLTPPADLVRAVRAAVGHAVPIVAMARPRAGDFLYDDAEFTNLCREAQALASLPVDAVVSGVLTPTSHVDRRRLRTLVDACGGVPVVLHRAFDFAPDPAEALEDAILAGCVRVLTTGAQGWSAGEHPLEARIERVRGLVEQAAGRIEILPCGGIRAGQVRAWCLGTGAGQVHTSCRERRALPCGGGSGLDAAALGQMRAAVDALVD
ncbi:MAG: hypothetical protein KF859_03200 [Phycisphaeraceae bacterium]|nr:hypothetical protein [Phycisphaeraceae bacterium]